MTIIDSFKGKYHFLSNFWLSPITYDNIVWPAVEYAYVYAKTLVPEEKKLIAEQSAGITPSGIKRFGRNITLRSDWEDVKVDIMRELIALKFAIGTHEAEKLLETGDVELVEGNTWGDTFWGVCNGVGQNMLGKLLVERREQLRNV